MLATDYNQANNVQIIISFNQNVSGNPVDITPVVIKATCDALTTEGAVLNVSVSESLGTVSSTPQTNQQIYAMVNGATTANTILSGLLKQLLVKAIGTDPSV